MYFVLSHGYQQSSTALRCISTSVELLAEYFRGQKPIGIKERDKEYYFRPGNNYYWLEFCGDGVAGEEKTKNNKTHSRILFIRKKFIRKWGSNGQNLKKIWRKSQGSISKL